MDAALSTLADPGSVLFDSLDAFEAFVKGRPDHEHWQLIAGRAVLSPTPTHVHQGIIENLINPLKAHFQATGLKFDATQNLGVTLPGFQPFEVKDDSGQTRLFRPEPDGLVIDDPDVFSDRSLIDRVFLTLEVLSYEEPNDKPKLDEFREKVALYTAHPDNLYYIIVDQHEIDVWLYAKENGWRPERLQSLTDTIRLPAFNYVCTVADIYKKTKFARR